jgi:vacuolar protein sorting-associated protein 35
MSSILLASFVIRLTVGQYPHQDSKRVLECLQKCLRIASSSIEEIVTVQLYCDALDEYLYYMDRGVPAVSNTHLIIP